MGWWGGTFFPFFFWLVISSIILALSVSPPFLYKATQIRGHIKQGLLPPPHYGMRLHFYREKTSALSSLADSHRIVNAPERSLPIPLC